MNGLRKRNKGNVLCVTVTWWLLVLGLTSTETTHGSLRTREKAYVLMNT